MMAGPAPQQQPAPPMGAMPPQPPGGSAMSMPSQPPVTIDAVMRLLRDNAHRRFRIDIETDSTVSGDEAQEKQDRAELIQGITKLVETWGPIVTAQPFMAKLAGELMLFGVRAFRVGRTLENVIEETVEKFEEAAGIPKGPPQPSPDELIKAQVAKEKGQAEIMKAQIDARTAQMEAQARQQEVALETRTAMMDHAHTMQQGQMQAGLADQKARNEAASQQMKAQIEAMRFEHAVQAANKPSTPDKG